MSGDGGTAEKGPRPEKSVGWADVQAYLAQLVSLPKSLADLEMQHAAARGKSEQPGATVADHHTAYILGALLQAAKIAQLGQVDLTEQDALNIRYRFLVQTMSWILLPLDGGGGVCW